LPGANQLKLAFAVITGDLVNDADDAPRRRATATDNWLPRDLSECR